MMIIKYEIDFEESLLLVGGKNVTENYEEMKLCHEFALQSTELRNSDKVGLLPGKLVKSDALFGPASKRNKTVIYPFSRCQLPCPCFICSKKPRPSCSCSADSAVCSNCV